MQDVSWCPNHPPAHPARSHRCTPLACARLQFPEKAIPKFILRAQRGQDLPIHGDGLSVRSYLYVEDVADAYITVLLKGQVGGWWLGAGAEWAAGRGQVWLAAIWSCCA